MPYNTRTRRKRDGLARYRSQNFRYHFAQDMLDYPGAPRILCEGDSWFGYPKKDLLEYIRESGAFNMLRVAKAGDELIANMMGPEQLARFKRALERWDFDLVLYSGGGNDIVGDDLVNYLTANGNPNDPSSYINATFNGVNGVLNKMKQKYHDIITLTQCPVIAHGYDYLQPSGKPFKFLGIKKGPWIKPTMEALGIPDSGTLRADIVKSLLDQFNEMLAALASTHASFHHVDLRGTLTPAASNWHNEIHPTGKGFKKLSLKYDSVMRSIIPGGFVSGNNWRALSRKHRNG